MQVMIRVGPKFVQTACTTKIVGHAAVIVAVFRGCRHGHAANRIKKWLLTFVRGPMLVHCVHWMTRQHGLIERLLFIAI
jgi:hypothetical protein